MNISVIKTALDKNKILLYLRRAFHKWSRDRAFNSFAKEAPQVVNSLDTIRYIIDNKSSVSRFGDGELDIMLNNIGNGFQQKNTLLAERLREVVNSEVDNHIVCIPYFCVNVENTNNFAYDLWRNYIHDNGKKILAVLRKDKYYDTQITRFYFDYVDKSQCQTQIDLLKEIWRDRDILIVEGVRSRMGVGNDLFAAAKSIRRVLAPAENAFDKYDDILSSVKQHVHKDDLVLLALGMTATVMAYDLSKSGFQAIDLGHLDIEYEWFLAKATRKFIVKNKYVNEVSGGNSVSECNDELYISQIVDKKL